MKRLSVILSVFALLASACTGGGDDEPSPSAGGSSEAGHAHVLARLHRGGGGLAQRAPRSVELGEPDITVEPFVNNDNALQKLTVALRGRAAGHHVPVRVVAGAGGLGPGLVDLTDGSRDRT